MQLSKLWKLWKLNKQTKLLISQVRFVNQTTF
jgi:hypothetical protein